MFFLNSATKIHFRSGVIPPGWCDPGRSAPHPQWRHCQDSGPSAPPPVQTSLTLVILFRSGWQHCVSIFTHELANWHYVVNKVEYIDKAAITSWSISRRRDRCPVTAPTTSIFFSALIEWIRRDVPASYFTTTFRIEYTAQHFLCATSRYVIRIQSRPAADSRLRTAKVS